MDIGKNKMKEAIKIYKSLVEKGGITALEDTLLYESYQDDYDVREGLMVLCESLGLHLCEYNHGLYISAGVGDKFHGYTNEEMRKSVSATTNKHLYLMMFVMHVIVGIFYKEGTRDSDISHYQIFNIQELVDKRISVLKELEDIEQSSKENEFHFKAVVDQWGKLPNVKKTDTEEGISKRGKSSKFQVIYSTVRFMEMNKLVELENNNIYILDRFKAIVWEAYTKGEVPTELSDYIYELEKSNEVEELNA